MKRWNLVVACIAPLSLSVGASSANAQETQEADKPGVVVTGSFFTRYEFRENYDKIGLTMGRFSEGDFVRYRARLGIATTPIDVGKGRTVTLGFTPQGSGYWADKGGTLGDGNIGLHAATLRIASHGYWTDIGRFEMAYGEHLVIGTVGWHETARSFDGVRSHMELSTPGSYVDVFLTQVAENPALSTPKAAGDQYFGGVYAGLGPMIGDMELDAYLLGQAWPKGGGREDLDLELTAGGRFKQNFGAVDFRAEAGLQFGAGNADKLAFQGDMEVGTTVGGGTRLALGGWYASGDDPTTSTVEGWNQLYPTAHKFLGWADIIGGRTNVMGGIVRARHKLSDLQVGADAHLFLQPESGAADSYTGLELDTFVLQSLGKDLGLRGGYSLFVPNETGRFGNDELVHYAEVQLKYDLK